MSELFDNLRQVIFERFFERMVYPVEFSDISVSGGPGYDATATVCYSTPEGDFYWSFHIPHKASDHFAMGTFWPKSVTCADKAALEAAIANYIDGLEREVC